MVRHASRPSSRDYCDRRRAATLLKHSVDLPAGILDSDDAKAAVGRAAAGKKLWPLIAIGKGDAKSLVNAIRLDGTALRDSDANRWQHVAAVLANALRRREIDARWDAFGRDIGMWAGDQRRRSIEFCRSMLAVCDEARAQSASLHSITANAFSLEVLSGNSSLCAALANQIRSAATAARLAAVEQERRRVRALFDNSSDRTSALVRQLLDDVIGKGAAGPDKVAAVWNGILKTSRRSKGSSPRFRGSRIICSHYRQRRCADVGKAVEEREGRSRRRPGHTGRLARCLG